VVCFHSEISVLVVHSTAASLAGLARPAASTGGCGIGRVERACAVWASICDIRIESEVTVGRDICTTLVGLLSHLEDVAELLSLVGLHRLLHMREPLICHFV